MKLRFLLLLFALSAPLVLRTFAVDPPPWYILDSPREDQLRYSAERSAESERLRTQVAARRFQEKKRRREAIAAGLQQELNIQREAMLRQTGQARSTTSRAKGSAEALEDILSGRYFSFVLFVVLLGIIYHFREKLLYPSANRARHFSVTYPIGRPPG